MVELLGGPFRMGSERFYPEEAPIHEVAVTQRNSSSFVRAVRRFQPPARLLPAPCEEARRRQEDRRTAPALHTRRWAESPLSIWSARVSVPTKLERTRGLL